MTDLSPNSSADDRGSLSAQLGREAVLDAFESAWRSGQRPVLREYLERCSTAERSELLGELLSLDCEYRYRAGERPSLEDYTALLPEYQSRLTRLLKFPSTVSGLNLWVACRSRISVME